MLQSLTADAIVLLAALWLVWTFAPQGFRSMVLRRKAAPAYDSALQADELAGQHAGEPDCGCGDKGCH